MEQRPDINDVRVSVARFADRLVKPVAELFPLLGRVEILVVLKVVAKNQVGPPLFMTASSDFLARAERLDLRTVREEDDARLPDAPLKVSEVLPDGSVFLDFGLDVPEEAFGLFRAVREYNLIVFVAIDPGVNRIFKREGRRLRVTSGGLDCPSASRGPVDRLRLSERILALEDALRPYPIELPVKLRGFPDEVVRKIGPAKVFQIERPELFPESLLPGEGCSLFIVPEELLAFLLAIGSPDDILLEKCLLIFPVCDRLAVFRLL